MIRIILFLLLIALGAAGAAWVAEQTGDVVLSWGAWRVQTTLPVFVLALGITVVAAMMLWAIVRDAVGHAGPSPPQPPRTASGPRPACGHARLARDRARRFQRGADACRDGAQTRRERSAGAAAACAVGATRRRPRRRAARLPRHGRTRGYAAIGSARPVHRGAARRRSRRRRHGRRGSAETVALVVMGVARRARLLLRQGRLGRRAEDPRQQSIRRADRQGDLSPAARRAADRARARIREGRSRSVARKRDGSDQAGADAGAGRGAREQVRKRGASGAALDAHRRDGVAGAAASRSGGCLCACEARQFRAPAAGAGADARRQGARSHRGRAGDCARRDRRRPNSQSRARRWRRSSPSLRSGSRC